MGGLPGPGPGRRVWLGPWAGLGLSWDSDMQLGFKDKGETERKCSSHTVPARGICQTPARPRWPGNEIPNNRLLPESVRVERNVTPSFQSRQGHPADSFSVADFTRCPHVPPYGNLLPRSTLSLCPLPTDLRLEHMTHFEPCNVGRSVRCPLWVSSWPRHFSLLTSPTFREKLLLKLESQDRATTGHSSGRREMKP